MSTTYCPYPIVSCLSKAMEFGKSSTGWLIENPAQMDFLEKVVGLDAQQSHFTAEELQSIASRKVEEINQFLTDHNFSITLEPFEMPEDFGVASVMNVLATWKYPGEKSIITRNDKQYPAAKLDDGIFIYQNKKYPNPVASIETLTGDRVSLTVAERPYKADELLEIVRGIEKKPKACKDYDGLIFPMVSLDQEVDISFLKGMWFQGMDSTEKEAEFIISQAKQQTRFKANHLGARAESAAAMGFACNSVPAPPLVIDKPFLIWMTRSGLTQPYFAGYIEETDWKDPGSL